MHDHLKRGKFDSLQLLRGFASVVVVFFHEFEGLGLFKYGKNGVDLFFVLSGFIIMYTHHAKIGESKVLVQFLLKRIIRVFPIYWLITFAYIVLVTTFGHSLSLDYIIKSLFLLPQDKSPVVGVAWTLEFEMLFYFIFGILMFNIRLFYSALIIWGITIIFFFIFPKDLSISIERIINPINLEFIFGCSIAVIVLKNKINFKWMTSLGIISVITSLTLQNLSILNMHNAIVWGIPFSILIFGLVKLETNKIINIPKSLVFLGDASYSIYLSHLLTLLILESSLKRLGVYQQYGHNSLVQLTFTVVAILAGCAFYSVVEKPLLKYTKSLFTKNNDGKLQRNQYAIDLD